MKWVTRLTKKRKLIDDLERSNLPLKNVSKAVSKETNLTSVYKLTYYESKYFPWCVVSLETEEMINELNEKSLFGSCSEIILHDCLLSCNTCPAEKGSHFFLLLAIKILNLLQTRCRRMTFILVSLKAHRHICTRQSFVFSRLLRVKIAALRKQSTHIRLIKETMCGSICMCK